MRVLIVLFLIGHFSSAAVFALAYSSLGTVVKAGDEQGVPLRTAPDVFYFSCTTQTTLGYGDLQPRGAARAISQLQTAFGIAYNTAFLGLVVARLLRTRGAVQFSPIVAFEPDEHLFTFWFWNRSRNDIANLRASVMLRKFTTRKSDEFIRIRNYEVLLRKQPPPFAEHMTTVVVRTQPRKQPEVCRELPPVYQPLCLGLLDLTEEQDQLVIVLAADDPVAQVTFAVRHIYHLQDVQCGIFRNVNPPGADFEWDWTKRPYQNFGQIDLTDPSHCQRCSLMAGCPLRQATIARERDTASTTGPTQSASQGAAGPTPRR